MVFIFTPHGDDLYLWAKVAEGDVRFLFLRVLPASNCQHQWSRRIHPIKNEGTPYMIDVTIYVY